MYAYNERQNSDQIDELIRKLYQMKKAGGNTSNYTSLALAEAVAVVLVATVCLLVPLAIFRTKLVGTASARGKRLSITANFQIVALAPAFLSWWGCRALFIGLALRLSWPGVARRRQPPTRRQKLRACFGCEILLRILCARHVSICGLAFPIPPAFDLFTGRQSVVAELVGFAVGLHAAHRVT